MSTATLPDLLDSVQAAEVIHVEPQTLAVWRSTARYGLPFIKVGRKVYYRRTDLERFLEERTVTQTGQAAGCR